MNYIPFIALLRFLGIIQKGGGLSWKGVLHLPAWIAKVVLLEPLRWTEALIFDRKIRKYHIEHSPVFILGHQRSGTTYLQRLISQDSRFGCMNAVQQIIPELMLMYEKPLTIIIQLVTRLVRGQNHFHRIPYDWQYPGEEDLGLLSMLSTQSPVWGYLFPEKFTAFYLTRLFPGHTEQKDKWKKDYLYLVHKVSIKNNHKPLILKSLPNTARIPELIELFPGAQFIYISRDPYELFTSCRRLWQVTFQYQVLGRTKGIDVDELIFSGLETMLNRYLKYRNTLPANNLIEISYEELIKDPLPTLNKIYVQLQLPEFDHCRPAMQKLAEGQKTYTRLEHTLPSELRDKIYSRWRIYIEDHERICQSQKAGTAIPIQIKG